MKVLKYLCQVDLIETFSVTCFKIGTFQNVKIKLVAFKITFGGMPRIKAML